MNREVEGFVDLMWDATRRFDAPLTAERLFSWHRALFPEPGGMEVQSQELLADARRRADIENVSTAFPRTRDSAK